MTTGSPRSAAWSSSQRIILVRMPRRRWVGETPTPVMPAAGDLTAAGHGQPERVGGAAPDPRLAVHGADRPIELPDRAIGLELGLIERVAEGGRDGRGERLERRQVVRRLAELDRVVVHRDIVPP